MLRSTAVVISRKLRGFETALRRCAMLALFSVSISMAGTVAYAQDFARFCKPESDKILLLIDRTTAFDEEDKSDLLDGLNKVWEELKPGDRLSVHTLAVDVYASRPLFDACRPKCGTSTWDVVTCDRVAASNANSQFEQRVVDKLREMITEPEQHANSLLVEGITQLTEEYDTIGITRLVIYSDLLQNSDRLRPGVMLARPESSVSRLKEASVIPSIPGAEVTAFGVGRWHGGERIGLTLEEGRALKRFWQAWFTEGGATKVTISQRYLGR